jgi:hypothetical protein
MLKISIPVEPGSTAVKGGGFKKVLEEAINASVTLNP